MNHYDFFTAAAFLSCQLAVAQPSDPDSCSVELNDVEEIVLTPDSAGSNTVYGGEEEKSLFEEVTKIQKKTDAFNLYLNMQGDFYTLWRGNTFDEGKFRMKQLRIEMTGQINDWLRFCGF